MLFILVEPFYDSHNKKSVGKLFQPIFLCFKNWNVMLIKLKKHLYNIFFSYLREFGIRKGLKKLVISSKIRIFIGEN